jgi:hypothetical protein
VDDPLFKVDLFEMRSNDSMPLGASPAFRILGLVHGKASIITRASTPVDLMAGGFSLIPANFKIELWQEAGSKVLLIQPGKANKPDKF